MTPEQLSVEIDRILETGDEEALKQFMLDHFAQLPENAQGEMLFSYFTDAVQKRAADSKITELQKIATEALEALKEERSR